MSQIIVKRYTQALFNLSMEMNVSGTVRHNLRMINVLTAKAEGLIEFLNNPVIPFEKREIILAQLFEKYIHPLTYQFILFLNKKKRLFILNDIYPVFESLYLDCNRILKIKITSGIKLDKRQEEAISGRLHVKFGKDIETDLKVDSLMVGGIKIQDGDTVYDYSLRTQLEKFKKNLINA